jgi:hypothetical protein
LVFLKSYQDLFDEEDDEIDTTIPDNDLFDDGLFDDEDGDL